jgi:hypothetical protein
MVFTTEMRLAAPDTYHPFSIMLSRGAGRNRSLHSYHWHKHVGAISVYGLRCGPNRHAVPIRESLFWFRGLGPKAELLHHPVSNLCAAYVIRLSSLLEVTKIFDRLC